MDYKFQFFGYLIHLEMSQQFFVLKQKSTIILRQCVYVYMYNMTKLLIGLRLSQGALKFYIGMFGIRYRAIWSCA